MQPSKPCVFIIEDDPSFRRGLVRLFENENCTVDDFEDASRALAAVQDVCPDFVVCDYKLPGMNGLELLRSLRDQNVISPFVLVTAHFTEDLQTRAKKEGALDAVAKPFCIDLLRDLLHSALDAR